MGNCSCRRCGKPGTETLTDSERALVKIREAQKKYIDQALANGDVDPLCDQVDGEVVDLSDIDLTKYKFHFENIVLEGGGIKGIAYCGAIQVYGSESVCLPTYARACVFMCACV